PSTVVRRGSGEAKCTDLRAGFARRLADRKKIGSRPEEGRNRKRPEMERLHSQGLRGVGYMTVRRKAFLLAGLLSMAAFANAASQNGIRITVLDSVTRSVSLGGNDVPKN